MTEIDKEYLNLYFGLDISKSKNEIKNIYEICCEIWNNCEHLNKNYPFGVYKTYQQYQNNYEFNKLSILSEALGNGLWNI